jgi:hypothetical protein
VAPLSFKKMQLLAPAWTIKNKIRNRPEKAITIFLPIDEVK